MSIPDIKFKQNVISGISFEGFKGFRNGNQSIPNNVETIIILTEVYDTYEYFDANIDNTKIVIKKDGYYQINASITCPGNGSGNRQILIRKNGVTLIIYEISGSEAGWTTQEHMGDVIYLLNGEYIKISVIQTSGVALNVLGGETLSFISIRRVG